MLEILRKMFKVSPEKSDCYQAPTAIPTITPEVFLPICIIDYHEYPSALDIPTVLT